MKLFKYSALISAIIAISLFAMSGCSNDTSDTIGGESTIGEASTNEDTTSKGDIQMNELSVELKFSGDTCEISDESAVEKNGKIYKITKAGIYTLTGSMDDGQIQVEVADTERVTLLLDNFNGKCSTSAVIYVINADKVYIDLEKDSVNTLTDATSYEFSDPSVTKPNACIYSADDLTIKGGGRLNVYANYNNGIGCKNDIDIKNGNITVSAVNNAIKGNNSVTVRGDAEVIISAAEDAIKTDNTKRDDKGYIKITDEAKVTITCTDDALQATQNVTVTENAKVTVIAASSAVNCDGTTDIAEGTLVIQ